MSDKVQLTAIDISASGLRAQRIRMNAIASNMANINTVKTEEGEPFHRRVAIMKSDEAKVGFRNVLDNARLKLSTTVPGHLKSVENTGDYLSLAGVEAYVELDNSPPRIVFDPTNPNSDESGHLAMPNINTMSEMVKMLSSLRSYEANLTAVHAAKAMARKAMKI